MALQKPPFLASLLTIISIIILCGLGTWQIQRLEWKQTLLAKIEAESGKKDTIITTEALETLSYNQDPYLYKRGTITGRFTGKTRILMPRTRDGKAGKEILAPIITENNRFLLVNLGWVPFTTEPLLELPIRDTVTLQGVLRRPDARTWLTPENNDENGILYAVDFNSLGTNFVPRGYDILPAVFYNETTMLLDTGMIVAHDGQWAPRNNHLSYALFWYTLAIILAIIFYIRFIKTPKAKND